MLSVSLLLVMSMLVVSNGKGELRFINYAYALLDSELNYEQWAIIDIIVNVPRPLAYV